MGRRSAIKLDQPLPLQALSARQLAWIIVSVALTTLITRVVQDAFPRYHLLFFFIPVVGGIGYLEGYSAGLLGAGFSILSAWYILLGGRFSFAIPQHALPVLLLFAIVTFTVAITSARLKQMERALAVERARLYAVEKAARQAAERTAERTTRLQDFTAALSEAVTPEQVAEVVVDQGTAALGAHAGSLCLLDDDGRTLEVIRSIGYPDELIKRWKRFSITTPMGITEAIQTGRTIIEEPGDAFAARYPSAGEVPDMLRRGPRAAIPLMVGGRAIGALCMNFQVSRHFSPEDHQFVRALARESAQALERSRLYARAHHVAETLQRAFLPVGLPEIPGVRLHVLYVPGTRHAKIGGDWYDVFALPDGRVAVSVGDAVGQGLQAAVMMGQIRQTIRAAALEGQSPSAVLNTANQVLTLTYEIEGMATAVFGLLDPFSCTLTYANAGHPAPMLAWKEAGVEALASEGLLLGHGGFTAPPERTVSLPPGCLLFLYTDGLIEFTRDIIEGESKLRAAVSAELEAPSDDPARAVFDRVIPGGHPDDDIAILTIAVAPTPADRVDLALSAVPSSSRPIRHALRRLCTALELPTDLAASIELATGEALNNVIEHAYLGTSGTVRTRAYRDGASLIVDIEDRGQWRPERAEGRGRGIRVMQSLADKVDITSAQTGTTVRLVFALEKGCVG